MMTWIIISCIITGTYIIIGTGVAIWFDQRLNSKDF